ncbi:MAG: hypothetical protein JRI36_09985 [Deltaproteobacteria bacterium]|nr:hypothetical protein [Deltaproteobacteria bacterium]
MGKRKVIALSLGYQLLAGFAVGIIQAITLLMDLHPQTISWLASPLIVMVGIPFNIGGFTIRYIFEALVEPLESIVGHRSAVVLGNFPFYLILLLIQMVIVSAVVLIRYKRTKTMKDWLIVTVFAIVFVNGLMNIMWPWWGS